MSFDKILDVADAVKLFMLVERRIPTHSVNSPHVYAYYSKDILRIRT